MGVEERKLATIVFADLDRARTEAEAKDVLKPGTYLEPFALRALGLAREDEELVQRALQRFEELGLDWYVEETKRLVAQA
jgi:hypothetical protein